MGGVQCATKWCGGVDGGWRENQNSWVCCDLIVDTKFSIAVTTNRGDADIKSFKGKCERSGGGGGKENPYYTKQLTFIELLMGSYNIMKEYLAPNIPYTVVCREKVIACGIHIISTYIWHKIRQLSC